MHLRLGRWSELYGIYAITKCVEGRRPVLANHACSKIILESLEFLRSRGQIKLLAFCVMPDHYHSMFALLNGSLSDMMRSLGKFTATQINKALHSKGGFWQEGFHDHRCRNVDDAIDLIAYIEHNPARAGLVAEASAWPYSSAFARHAHLLDRDWCGSQV